MAPSAQILSKIVKRCRSMCGLESRHQQLEISAPFDFKVGPSINFPGYSKEDVSLIREKAIASAITDDNQYFDSNNAPLSHPQSRSNSRSRSSSINCGLGNKAMGYQVGEEDRSNMF